MRVNAADVETQSRNAIAVADDIKARLAQLGSRMDGLRGSWTGPAAGAYFDVWSEIDAECHDMIDDLRWVGDSLAATASAYRGMDHANADALGGVGESAPDPGVL